MISPVPLGDAIDDTRAGTMILDLLAWSDGTQVGFARSGLTVHWDARYASLLELAEACDVPARWSCRTGVCHTCETSLLSGTIGYAPDPVDNPADGNVLICCSQPVDDLVLDM